MKSAKTLIFLEMGLVTDPSTAQDDASVGGVESVQR